MDSLFLRTQPSPTIPLHSILTNYSPNPLLARHNTFLISDKKVVSNKANSRPKIQLTSFYELNLKKDKNSLTNLLKLDNFSIPKVKSTGAKLKDLHIYNDLKKACKLFVNNSSIESKTTKKSVNNSKISMLKEIQQEYYLLQKTSIENYLKGVKINQQLIEMDFFSFLKLKKSRLIDQLSEMEVKREITPIEKIISGLWKMPKKKEKLISIERTRKRLDLLIQIIEKEPDCKEIPLNKEEEQIMKKMRLYNQYYLNYFSSPEENRQFTTLKDLSLSRFSLSKELFTKTPEMASSIKPNIRNSRMHKSIRRTYSKERSEKSKGWQKVEKAKIGCLLDLKKNMEKEDIEYVKVDQQKLLEWGNSFPEQKEFNGDERKFFRAVKTGDLKTVNFHLIDNKNFLKLKDQVIFLIINENKYNYLQFNR